MKLFGHNKKKREEAQPAQEEEEEEEKEEEEEEEQPIAIDYYARYMGSHPMYPKDRDVTAVFWNEGFEIRFNRDKPAEIAIAYKDMTNVDVLSEEHVKAGRVIVAGIIGALWKKKEKYTVIEYKDELGKDRAIVMNFHGNIEKLHQLIYQKLLESRK